MKALTATILTVLFSSLLHAAAPAKIVILYGDRSHGSGAHEFKAGAKLLKMCLEDQDAVDVEVTTHQNWPADNLELLDSADAIVFYNDSTKIVKNGWEKVDELAKKGTGLMFMHYAVHPSIEEGEKYFKSWMGGYYHNDKSVNPFWNAEIKTLIGHPTAEGIGDIETIDEFYHSLEFTGDSSFKKLGVATPTKQNLIMNTMVWVAGREVPKGGVTVRPLTEDELNANLDDYSDKGGIVRLALPTADNRPPFAQNAFLPPEERAKVKQERKEWGLRRKELIDQLIIPVTK